jgi:hypothetical protein
MMSTLVGTDGSAEWVGADDWVAIVLVLLALGTYVGLVAYGFWSMRGR